jgi:methylmalonyl-CoA mutase N-terminal domain/subunit
VEALTREIEQDIHETLRQVDELGGMLQAIEKNYFQREIADFAYEQAQRKASGERTVVGVNKYVDEGESQKVETHQLDPSSEKRKINRLETVKRNRDNETVTKVLDELVTTARDPAANLMPATIAAVKAQASLGEIVTCLEPVFGRYRETAVF